MTLTFTNLVIPEDFFHTNKYDIKSNMKIYSDIMNKGDDRTIKEDNLAKIIIYDLSKEQHIKEKFINKYNDVFNLSLKPIENFWMDFSTGKTYFSNIEIINNSITGEVNFDSSDYNYDWLEDMLSRIGISGKFEYYCPDYDAEYNEAEELGQHIILENGNKTKIDFEF